MSSISFLFIFCISIFLLKGRECIRMQRSFPLLKSESIFSATWTEVKKLSAFLSAKVRHKVADNVKMVRYISGEDVYSDETSRIRRQKHQELYSKIIEQTKQIEAEKKRKKLQGLPLWARWKANLREGASAFQQSTSVEAGKMVLLQHCAASHAAEIALANNVDLKNIRMVIEKQRTSDGREVAAEEKDIVVGYIDAPNISEEEMHAFAAAVQRSCPVSRHMTIEWRSEPYASSTVKNVEASKGEENDASLLKDTRDNVKEGNDERRIENSTENVLHTHLTVEPPPIGMPGVPIGSRNPIVESSPDHSSTKMEGDVAGEEINFHDSKDQFSLPGISARRRKP